MKRLKRRKSGLDVLNFNKLFVFGKFLKRLLYPAIDRVWDLFRRLSGRSMTGGQKRLGPKKKKSAKSSENKAKKRAASLAAVDSARHDPLESRRVVADESSDAAESPHLDVVSPTPSDQLVIDEGRMDG